MRVLLAIALALTISPAKSQNCSITLTGFVKDEISSTSLSNTTVFIRGLNRKVVADSSGLFRISNICAGLYTIQLTYVDYDTLVQSVQIASDTTINFLLSKKGNQLQNVTVTGYDVKKDQLSTIASAEIKGTQLFQTSGSTLGESLKAIPGLNSLQTGPSLSKPIIHGLHSNRVLILNNGIRQEGQQWGSEHAPEIDPFIASKITILKGAASVRYGSDAIVGVVLLEPHPLAPQKSLEGEVNAVAATNGRMGVVSGLLDGKIKKLNGFSWRIQGTLKRAGNFKTPNYFLENTGLYEGDYSLTANYKRKNYGVEVYYSSFYNKVGIFSGSHVGNAADLDSAFARKVPITPSYFSYEINRTYQNVKHDLLKANAYYSFNNGSKLEAVFGTQKNRRDEYDIDLPYSTDPEVLEMPQISFTISTQTLDIIYELTHKNNFEGSVGVSGETQGNVYRGIRYLVPNFRNYSGGAFALEKYTRKKLTLEAGARYDYKWLRAYFLNSTSLVPYQQTHDYSNITGTVGSTYRFNNQFSISGNIGSAWRSPSVNELYINGIHLSAASYERGDSLLQSERSYDFTLSAKYEGKKIAGEIVLYDNIINNFIYAMPTLQPITLISGTYPFFQYTQANVNLKGFDIDVTYNFAKHFSIESKTSLLRAWNKTIDNYLVFMPADRFDNTLKYSLSTLGKLTDLYISLQNLTVLEQTRVPPKSDYVDPPPGYSLFNANIGFTTNVGKHPLNIDLGAYNFTNVAYRDYLNRFRYYADDLGINIVLKTKINF